jgi:RNA polymerase sigma factor (sigma-70 family)
LMAGKRANETDIVRLYSENFQALVDYARGFVGLHDAPDIVHKVFLHIFKLKPRWAGSEVARAALFVAVRRAGIDLIRHRNRWQVVALANYPEIELNTRGSDGGEVGEVLRDWILNALDPLYSRVLLLQLDGLRVSEIARMLRIPLGTAKWRLNMATTKLRKNKEKANLLGF